MGTWGHEIFDDDLASDVKGSFEDALSKKGDAKNATKDVLSQYADVISDPDEGHIIQLALAKIQMEKGVLQSEIKKQAIEILENGIGLTGWTEAGKDELEKRQVVYKILLEQLRDAGD